MTHTPGALLGPAEIRELAGRLGVRPTKTLGQNFVHDGGTVRKIVRTAGVEADDVVVEVGPGLGSLTLALLETGARVVAIEIDEALAAALPRFGRYRPGLARALEHARAGRTEYLTDHLASYHTLWFQLHEDLLATLGIPR